jgi:hypothetical protein
MRGDEYEEINHRIRTKAALNALMDGTAEDIPPVDGDIIVVLRDSAAKSKERK